MRGLLNISLAGALLACAGTVAAIAPAPVAATGSYSPYDETPAAALARYVRTLASNPKDFDALIGAGRAALEIGDAQAAGGFFARADEVNPRSPYPQAGMGAVSVANGEPQAALPYFARAQKLGATLAMIGCARGLAYDLLGNQAQAQADYRAALAGADRDEARRRLALSLAISGDKAAALNELAPLSAAGDPGVGRTRAFVLALSGDSNGAMVAIDAAMPGSWARVSPFLQRLPALAAGQKAAAVNLGIFPDAGDSAYASSAPTAAPLATASSTAASSTVLPSTVRVAGSVSTDRLAGIDALLHPGAPPRAAPAAAQQPAPSAWQQPRPTQISYVTPSLPTAPHASPPASQGATIQQRKIWLQLASGRNADALKGEFRRMKSRNRDVLEGIPGYLTGSGDRSRLLVGPFRGTSDAENLAADLKTVGIDAFRWTNSPSDRIVPLASE
jgi:Flp pilus assembly protein TadD